MRAVFVCIIKTGLFIQTQKEKLLNNLFIIKKGLFIHMHG